MNPPSDLGAGPMEQGAGISPLNQPSQVMMQFPVFIDPRLVQENQRLQIEVKRLEGQVNDLQTKLQNVHTDLMAQHLKEMEEIRADNRRLKDENAALEVKNVQLEQQIEKLKATVAVLEKELAEQKIENKSLQDQITSLNNRLNIVENRDNPITVREVMRTLENHMCLNIVKTVTQARRYFNFSKLRNNPEHNQRLEAKGWPLDLIDELKDRGDRAAHHERPSITVQELDSLLTQYLSRPDISEEDAQAKDNLFKLLNDFKMVGDDGLLITTPPF